MSEGGNDGENMSSTMSARDDPQNIEQTKELTCEDMTFSDLLRTMTEMYREDQVFREPLTQSTEENTGR